MSRAHYLTFHRLTVANMRRLPLFRNKHNAPAHSTEDGHDWSPAQWLQAVVGELGELAQARILYEDGILGAADFEREAGKEVADVQVYLSILAKRFLDRLDTYKTGIGVHDSEKGLVGDEREAQGCPFASSVAQETMRVVAYLGEFANARKKYDRGDLNGQQYHQQASEALSALSRAVSDLKREALHMDSGGKHPGDVVSAPHPTGIDLPAATVDKFNEVSRRVRSPVFLANDGCALLDYDPGEPR